MKITRGVSDFHTIIFSITDVLLGANEVISSLKADMAYQTSLAKDSKALKKKIESQKTEITAFETQVAQLKAALAESQAENKTVVAESKSLAIENKTLTAENRTVTTENKTLATENKTLNSKLAANRTAAASVESLHSKVPGSAAKPNGGIRMVGTAEAAQLAQAAQLKEDIYSDLTGLVIQGVKRDAEDDIFNCLQTSRNGSKFPHLNPFICFLAYLKYSSSFQTSNSKREISRNL